MNSKPFFGKVQKLVETIHSLDEKWYVEFWEVHYYFIGIEVFISKKEIVRTVNGNNGNGVKTSRKTGTL